MERTLTATPKLNKREGSQFLIYILVFLFTLHITPATYIESSFLEIFIQSENVGYIFTIGSIITLFTFIFIHHFLKKFGNFKTFLFFLIIDFISLAIMSFSLIYIDGIWPWIFVISYIAGFVARSVCFMNLDIFLEHFSSDSNTGEIRGAYLTSLNIAFILGPIITGMLITNALEAGKIYILGTIILIPVILINIFYFNEFKDPKYEQGAFLKTIRKISRSKNLFNIFSANFLMRFFYSWMIIYTPIFLVEKIGFDLGQVTTMIGIALIAFVLLQLPLGKIADKYWGEKEFLIIGFIITGISTAMITFFDSQNFIFWVGILFITRIGIAMVEIMTETYLFKKIKDDDIDIISLYRSVRPAAYIVGPMSASLILLALPINSLFLILGIIMLSGVWFSSRIKDTL